MNDKESKKTANIPDADLIWEPVSVEHVIQDQWMDLRKVEYRFQLLDGSDAVLSQTAYSASPKADIDLPDYQPYKVRVLARQKGSTKPFERTATVVLKSGESNE